MRPRLWLVALRAAATRRRRVDLRGGERFGAGAEGNPILATWIVHHGRGAGADRREAAGVRLRRRVVRRRRASRAGRACRRSTSSPPSCRGCSIFSQLGSLSSPRTYLFFFHLRNVRHVLAERGGEVDLVFLFLSQDFANLFRDRELAERVGLPRRARDRRARCCSRSPDRRAASSSALSVSFTGFAVAFGMPPR